MVGEDTNLDSEPIRILPLVSHREIPTDIHRTEEGEPDSEVCRHQGRVPNRTALNPGKEIPTDTHRKLARVGDILRDKGCIPMVFPVGSTNIRRSSEPLDLAGNKLGGMVSRNKVSDLGRKGEDRIGSHCNLRRRMNRSHRDV